MRARGVARKRLVVVVGVAVLLGVFVFGVLTTSAPAGNRDPEFGLEDFPGPDEVTFGKNVAYTATFENTQSSTFTHVFFRMDIPSTRINSNPLPAELLYASCEPDGPPFAGLTSTAYTCPEFDAIPAGSPPKEVTLVWRTPSIDPTGLTCDTPSVTDCKLTATGGWSIKENQPGSNDTFPVGPVVTTMLLQPNPTRAGTYAITSVPPGSCTTESANLVTNLAVNAGNRIATAVCAGTLPGLVLDKGLTVKIDEDVAVYGPGFTAMSRICVPKPDVLCPASVGNTWQFTPTVATHIFKIPEIGFPKGEKLDLAYHNGGSNPYPGCTFVKDNRTKIWTVTCPAATNGDWRFG